MTGKHGQGSFKHQKQGHIAPKALITNFTMTAAVALPPHLENKMAPAPEELSAPITKRDLQEFFYLFESRMLTKFTELLQPMDSRLGEIHSVLQQVADTAENALENSITNQESIRQLEQHESWAHDKLISLENSLRQNCLKLRGFPEGAEETSELTIFLASWMASTLNLESGIAPLLYRAFCLGSASRPADRGPRDIIVEFADPHSRFKIFQEAHAGGFLPFKDSKNLAFPNLSTEALSKRKSLQPISSKLSAAGIRYRWASNYDLTVQFHGKLLSASDLDSGLLLLQELHLEPPPDFGKAPQKRKSETFQTPPKWSKIPVHTRPG